MYCKSRTNGVGLWDPRVGNMTYPEPYRNPLRRLYPGMSKSMDGLGSLGAFNPDSAASYNASSTSRFGWALNNSAAPNGISSAGSRELAILVYNFQKLFMGESQADGKIGPKTLAAVARYVHENPGPPDVSSPTLLAFIITPVKGGQAETAIKQAIAESNSNRGRGLIVPDGRTGGGGGRSGGGGTTPRRSMSDGDEMNLDVAPPPKDPKDPKESSVPMPLAIGGGVLIAVGLALFMKNKN